MNKILGFGELMLRLTPSKHYDLISETNDFSASFGGAEANVIIDLASRGHNCEFLTAFPENEIGKKAISYLKNYGVDTSNILFDNERLGKYYIEHGFSTRSSNIIYDRKNSSFSKLTIENSKLEKIIDNVSHIVLSGITPALSDNCYKNIIKICEIAKSKNKKIIYDINYRKTLWSTEDAKKFNKKILSFVDYLFTNSSTIEEVFNVSFNESNESDIFSKSIDAVNFLKKISNFEFIGMTIRNEKKLSGMFFHNNEIIKSEALEVEHLDRIGAGDAFVAGTLHGILNNWEISDTLVFAVASFGITHTSFGDINSFSDKQIIEFSKNKLIGNVKR